MMVRECFKSNFKEVVSYFNANPNLGSNEFCLEPTQEWLNVCEATYKCLLDILQLKLESVGSVCNESTGAVDRVRMLMEKDKDVCLNFLAEISDSAEYLVNDCSYNPYVLNTTTVFAVMKFVIMYASQMDLIDSDVESLGDKFFNKCCSVNHKNVHTLMKRLRYRYLSISDDAYVNAVMDAYFIKFGITTDEEKEREYSRLYSYLGADCGKIEYADSIVAMLL